MEAGMLVQEWTVSEVWVSEHDGVRSTYAGELWGRLRLVNPTFGFEARRPMVGREQAARVGASTLPSPTRCRVRPLAARERLVEPLGRVPCGPWRALARVR